ncbi:unnamed protein product, partial [Prorocentrum cordatum]
VGVNRSAPVGHYSDGAPRTKKDSLTAFYWSNCISKQRHLITAVRKSGLRGCGCRGVCTIDGAMQ